VKRVRWTIVILGLLCVSLGSIIPRADDPETAFNETDTPVNLTTPFVARTTVGVPSGHSVDMPREQQVGREPGATIYAIALKPIQRTSHSLLDLLRTLRC
jgi:hypothetical protein